MVDYVINVEKLTKGDQQFKEEVKNLITRNDSTCVKNPNVSCLCDHFVNMIAMEVEGECPCGLYKVERRIHD